MKVGPMHVHKEQGMHSAWDAHVKQAPPRPQFMVEFGKEGEDFGGCFVCYSGWCCRERDATPETYAPHVLAKLITEAPNMQAEIDDLHTICEAHKRRYEKAEVDLKASEDNAGELQDCYDEMLPICKQAETLKGALVQASKDFYYIHEHDGTAHQDSYGFMGKVEQVLKDLND